MSDTITKVTVRNNCILLEFNGIEHGLRNTDAGTPSLQINNTDVDPTALIGRTVIDHIRFLGMRYDPIVLNNKIVCIEYYLYSYLLDNGDLLNTKITIP
jgi:hypothetical protein